MKTSGPSRDLCCLSAERGQTQTRVDPSSNCGSRLEKRRVRGSAELDTMKMFRAKVGCARRRLGRHRSGMEW